MDKMQCAQLGNNTSNQKQQTVVQNIKKGTSYKAKSDKMLYEIRRMRARLGGFWCGGGVVI